MPGLWRPPSKGRRAEPAARYNGCTPSALRVLDAGAQFGRPRGLASRRRSGWEYSVTLPSGRSTYGDFGAQRRAGSGECTLAGTSARGRPRANARLVRDLEGTVPRAALRPQSLPRTNTELVPLVPVSLHRARPLQSEGSARTLEAAMRPSVSAQPARSDRCHLPIDACARVSSVCR